jgi:hypothetical protein
VATTVIGAAFAGVSLADELALQDSPARLSRFGPTMANLTPPDCNRPLVRARSARLELDLWGDVDRRAVGTVSLTGARSGTDVSWMAQVVASDVASIDKHGVIRIGDQGWTQAPGMPWATASPGSLDGDLVDQTVVDGALSLTNRATAENRGLEYVERARARHCRVAVDGATFLTSFPQVTWLINDADVSTWRGEIDFWVFGDGEVGMVKGSVNGNAQGILAHGLLATVQIKLTATDRDTAISISPPA